MPNSNKLLTVCVPSYNVEQYLDKCLYTLTRPTRRQQLDLIIVDDGSTDTTAALGLAWQKKYPGVVTYIYKENGGHGSAINTGQRHATGKYFKVVDGDDWVDIEQFDLLIEALSSSDEDIVSSHYHKVDDNTNVQYPFTESGVAFNTTYRFEELDVDNRYFCLANSVFKTRLLKDLNFPLQEKTFYVDVEYILSPIPRVATVKFLDLFVYKYRVGLENQSINTKSFVDRYEHHDRVVKRMLEYIYANPAPEAHRAYCQRIMRLVVQTHYSISLRYDPSQARAIQRVTAFDALMRERYSDMRKSIPWRGILLLDKLGPRQTKLFYTAYDYIKKLLR